ncbi:MAG: heme ABC transporter ATP-binding protein [Corynebacterium sp.]|uniref:heme ABC transporter ATP-binding protein n=1 Tax=Corynebacterium sp. TaxID=1720 RepID=UPI001813AB59|nr:heme ABC transporter ATP-binding protein [Corynebacterium sp.]NWO15651.1 heme ABC transporter ATP-binding protein [Corynebacterium sp.]
MLKVTDVSIDIAGKRIVDNVSFTARTGTVTGLIGPNGAGKSTLLSALAGDMPLSSGAVQLEDTDPQITPVKELARIRSVMLQDVSLAFSFLVRDVVEMGRRPWARTEQAALDDEIIDAALEATGTTHLMDRDIMVLSGGERARVAMARVLAQRTPIVFFDEPTAAMDIHYQEKSLGLIRELALHGATVVVVLHDLNAAAAYCDSIVCLDEGKVAASGDVDSVFTSDILSKVYGWPIEVTKTTAGVHIAPRRAEPGTLHHSLITSPSWANSEATARQ